MQSFSFQFRFYDSASRASFLVSLGLYTSKCCLILLKFWPEIVSIKTNTVFGKSFKIFNFDSNETHPKFTVLVHFGVQFTTGQPKILLKTKIFAKAISLVISNSVSPRPQKNHRILVKSNKKTLLGSNWV